VGLERITEEVIQASKRLKIIAKHGAGVDNIDIKAASSKGIVVINAPGANSDAVAELTVGFLIGLARNIPFADRSVRTGKWPRMIGGQLNHKNIGIIGLGKIGKKVAKLVSIFNMKVLAYDVFQDEAFAREWGITYLDLDELLVKSDYISIHVPFTSENRNLLSERELGLMKKDAFLLNLSRGDIVDEEVLYRALQEGRIRGAGLDVFLNEPPKESPLLKLDNVILTPHMGGYTFEALKETGMICADGIVDVLEGRQPQFVANPEVLN
jgi:D-3-phosphoglycerate dehydrogenase